MRAQRAIPVLDLRPVLEPIVRARGVGAAFYVHAEPGQRGGIGHMNPAGNRARRRGDRRRGVGAARGQPGAQRARARARRPP